jgi:tRNA(Arg) A34 adenosine deaminase TadA
MPLKSFLFLEWKKFNKVKMKIHAFALRQAEMAFDAKEVPIGCVIVKEGKSLERLIIR